MLNWTMIALVTLAVIGVLLLLYRNNGTSKSPDKQQDRLRPQPDYVA